ncbi:hypothetical protein IW262DRAFT_1529362 [Armillaria fumosa]|nr:hypothetical protein IW262DRAFT_1529362 [Armillaria fumosa]
MRMMLAANMGRTATAKIYEVDHGGTSLSHDVQASPTRNRRARNQTGCGVYFFFRLGAGAGATDEGSRTGRPLNGRRSIGGLIAIREESKTRQGLQGYVTSSYIIDDLANDVPALTAYSLVSRPAGVLFSSLAEFAAFFGCVPHLRKLAMNVATIGRGDDNDGSHQGGLCKELEMLKVGTGNLRPRWMRFLFGRDGVISLENVRESVFPVTSEVDSWMPGVHELFGRAPRLESAMLLDWRRSHQNLHHITPIPDISHLHSLTLRRALVPKKTKVEAADTAICALDWTRSMLDTGTRLEKAAVIVNASSVIDDEGVRAVWMRLLRPNVVVLVEGECLETTWARIGNTRVQPAERRETFYEL